MRNKKLITALNEHSPTLRVFIRTPEGGETIVNDVITYERPNGEKRLVVGSGLCKHVWDDDIMSDYLPTGKMICIVCGVKTDP